MTLKVQDKCICSSKVNHRQKPKNQFDNMTIYTSAQLMLSPSTWIQFTRGRLDKVSLQTTLKQIGQIILQWSKCQLQTWTEHYPTYTYRYNDVNASPGKTVPLSPVWRRIIVSPSLPPLPHTTWVMMSWMILSSQNKSYTPQHFPPGQRGSFPNCKEQAKAQKGEKFHLKGQSQTKWQLPAEGPTCLCEDTDQEGR